MTLSKTELKPVNQNLFALWGEPSTDSTKETVQGKPFQDSELFTVTRPKLCNGNHRAEYPNGDIFEGDMLDGKRHGNGTYNLANQERYEGKFAFDEFSGDGKYYSVHGNGLEEVYQGQFKHNLRNGEGVFQYHDGAKYTGGWRDGARDGQGKMVWKDGSVYTGGFQNDGRHGQGKIVNERSGYTYEGDFQDDARSGKGKLELANGNGSYEGEFLLDKPHGFGVFKDAKETYEGEFAGGLRQGHGILVDLASNESYTGSFETGSRHGEGVLSTGDGDFNVKCENGALIRSSIKTD